MNLRKPLPEPLKWWAARQKGKAIIVLNPAEPPLMMRDTVYVLSDEASQDDIEASINEMAEAVQAYVPISPETARAV